MDRYGYTGREAREEDRKKSMNSVLYWSDTKTLFFVVLDPKTCLAIIAR